MAPRHPTVSGPSVKLEPEVKPYIKAEPIQNVQAQPLQADVIPYQHNYVQMNDILPLPSAAVSFGGGPNDPSGLEFSGSESGDSAAEEDIDMSAESITCVHPFFNPLSVYIC